LEQESSQPLSDRASREAFVREHYIELFRWFCGLTGSGDRAADQAASTLDRASFPVRQKAPSEPAEGERKLHTYRKDTHFAAVLRASVVSTNGT
jgi:hypothetical protein